MTKTREHSKNWSRDAIQLRFDNHRLPQDTISGRQSIGAPSVDGSRVGNYTPSVQSAIEDLAGISVARINEVVMFQEGDDPHGVSMIERLMIDGTASGEPLFVYGFRIELSAGDNRAVITQKIYDTLQTVQAEKGYFKSITKLSGTDNELDIEFVDFRPHDNTAINMSTLTVIGSTVQSAQPGYGTWVKIGEQDLTSDTVTTKVIYFKRTA